MQPTSVSVPYCLLGGPDVPCPATVQRCTTCFVSTTDGFSAAADGGMLLPGTMCAPYCGIRKLSGSRAG